MSSSASSPPPQLISDQLWALVEPLIPPQQPAVHGRTGRPRVSDRDVLQGIAFAAEPYRPVHDRTHPAPRSWRGLDDVELATL
jgi:transposase